MRTVKTHIVWSSLLAAVVAAALAVPAEAAKKKRKPAQVQKSGVTYADRNDVWDADRVVGRDPDPFIRAMIQRDPRPWETND